MNPVPTALYLSLVVSSAHGSMNLVLTALEESRAHGSLSITRRFECSQNGASQMHLEQLKRAELVAHNVNDLSLVVSSTHGSMNLVLTALDESRAHGSLSVTRRFECSRLSMNLVLTALYLALVVSSAHGSRRISCSRLSKNLLLTAFDESRAHGSLSITRRFECLRLDIHGKDT